MRDLVVLVTGASSGFGRLIAFALAQSGHTVYASMRDAAGRNTAAAAEVAERARTHRVDLHAIEMDVGSEASVATCVAELIDAHARIDVIVHNAGHMTFGPVEAFTPDQIAALYDVNVIGAHRVNRAALPHMRLRGQGLLVWVSSSSVAGGTPPWLAPYFAAKAGMDALAVQYARELARWGVETSIIVPGAFTRGTNHFAHATAPADLKRAAEYEAGPYAGCGEAIQKAFGAIVPKHADVGLVAEAVVQVVGSPPGERPFRVHVDPSDDGASVSFPVIDRVRDEMLRRVGFDDLLVPRRSALACKEG